MNVKGTMIVRMAASTDLAPTSVHVPKGTCCVQMDGHVNVSQFCVLQVLLDQTDRSLCSISLHHVSLFHNSELLIIVYTTQDH